MVTSDQTPVLDPSDVYSTTLPENLRTTDPLIFALANYTTGIQTLFANFAGIKEDMERTGFFKPEYLDIGIPPTKYIVMAINYRQHRELPVSPQELKDAMFIEKMNAVIYKTIEPVKLIATRKSSGQKMEGALTSADIVMENIMKLDKAFVSDEAKDIWVRLFGKLGIPAEMAIHCVIDKQR
ncbi:Protein of unknown function [Pyronema omphalodes CBS 100304]|uniref:Uncharacterized protein n=1 Tax=Pyronema omphalodes (strain CBS 100304) TaxID=1076935 RepID=U4LJ44_PYROM|nr:Protein of unknown function [Pyronema omphalodes CBS 100304]